MKMRVAPWYGAMPRPGAVPAVPAPAVPRRRFQTPDHRRADRNHTAARRACFIDGIAGGLGHRQVLLVHLVPFDVVHAHRLEGAGADVQGDEGVANAARFECGENIRIEMQARRGRRDRSQVARVHGLIAFAIGAFRLAPDVGRQRHLAVGFEKRHDLARELQVEQIALPPQHARLRAAGQLHDRIRRLSPCWP